MLPRVLRIKDVNCPAPRLRRSEIRERWQPPYGFRAHDRAVRRSARESEPTSWRARTRCVHVIGVAAKCRVPPAARIRLRLPSSTETERFVRDAFGPAGASFS